MNILQVCPGSYQVGRGGISEHVRNISERLAKKHNVIVFATNPNNELPNKEFVNGVYVERYKRYAPGGAYFFSLEMMLRIRKMECDVVHGHGFSAFPMHFSTMAKHVKFVVTTHYHGYGHSILRDCLLKLFRPIGGMTLQKAYKIIAVSNFEKTLLYRDFKLNEEKVVVIPNGLSLKEFYGLKRKSKLSRTILFVGRLEAYKGVQYLIEVLPLLGDDVILEVVGRGPLKQYLIQRVKKLHLDDRVQFFENLSRIDLLQKYFNSDIFVLLSKHESYSLVVAEALSAGTKCIVANSSALSEWIDNEFCYGVDLPINLKHLSSLITGVLNDNVDKENMVIGKSKKIYSWDDVVTEIEKVYINS